MPPERERRGGGLCRRERKRERESSAICVWQTETDTPSSLYTHTFVFTNSRHTLAYTHIHRSSVTAGGDERRCERRLAASNRADAHVTDKLTEITTVQVFLCLYEMYGYYILQVKLKYIVLGMGYYMWLSMSLSRIQTQFNLCIYIYIFCITS